MKAAVSASPVECLLGYDNCTHSLSDGFALPQAALDFAQICLTSSAVALAHAKIRFQSLSSLKTWVIITGGRQQQVGLTSKHWRKLTLQDSLKSTMLSG